MAADRFPPVHPGETLRKEFLDPMGITEYRLAKDIHVPQSRIAEITRGRRSISADTGLRLSRYFGMTEGFWVGLQETYDVAVATGALGDELDNITPVGA